MLVDGAVEVVDDRQQLGQQHLVGQADHLLAVLLGPALVVGEVGGRALPAGLVLGRFLLGGDELLAQLVDLARSASTGECPARRCALRRACAAVVGAVVVHRYSCSTSSFISPLT